VDLSEANMKFEDILWWIATSVLLLIVYMILSGRAFK